MTAGFGCPEDFGVPRTRGPPCHVAFGDVLISCFRSLFIDWGLLDLFKSLILMFELQNINSTLRITSNRIFNMFYTLH